MTTTDTTPEPLRLEAGRTYVTKDGSKVTLQAHVNNAWPFTNDQVTEFWSNGVGKAAHARNGQSYSDRYQNKGPGANLVAEWTEPTPSPVRTGTTTRTEIQPGTYGRVHVRRNTGQAKVMLSLVAEGHVSEFGALCSATELRAAAATFTELAAGLEAIEKERNEAK